MIILRDKEVESVGGSPAMPSARVPDLPPLTPSGRQALAESILGEVRWYDEVTGFATCPGDHHHTTAAGVHDCRVKLDGVPTIHCVHASCRREIVAANRALRTQTLAIDPVPLTPEMKRMAKAAKAKAAREHQLRVRAEKSLPGILKKYSWPYDQIVADSPLIIGAKDRQSMVESFLDLFEDGDVIWVGDVTDTGQVIHAPHFKAKKQWRDAPLPYGPLTCPSTFFPGSVSRSKDNVSTQPYLVVESDRLAKDEVGAIFRWLKDDVGLHLHAVVDTAGKSLHGWFEFPSAEVLEELKIMLPAMGCDSKMFGASQPCRLPGGLRDGKIQRLIYCAKVGAQ